MKVSCKILISCCLCEPSGDWYLVAWKMLNCVWHKLWEMVWVFPERDKTIQGKVLIQGFVLWIMQSAELTEYIVLSDVNKHIYVYIYISICAFRFRVSLQNCSFCLPPVAMPTIWGLAFISLVEIWKGALSFWCHNELLLKWILNVYMLKFPCWPWLEQQKWFSIRWRDWRLFY